MKTVENPGSYNDFAARNEGLDDAALLAGYNQELIEFRNFVLRKDSLPQAVVSVGEMATEQLIEADAAE